MEDLKLAVTLVKGKGQGFYRVNMEHVTLGNIVCFRLDRAHSRLLDAMAKRAGTDPAAVLVECLGQFFTANPLTA